MCCAVTQRREEENVEVSNNNDDDHQEYLLHEQQQLLGSWKSYYCCNNKVHEVSEQDDTKCWWWLFYSWFLLIRDTLCLMAFVVVLSPGFVRFAWYYAITAHRVSVKYGTTSCRQTLDVYTLPPSSTVGAHAHSAVSRATEESNSSAEAGVGIRRTGSNSVSPCLERTTMTAEPGSPDESDPSRALLSREDVRAVGRPVVLFFPGGAWMIGYKMWGALTARVLTHVFGIVTVMADYQNHIPPYWCSSPATIPDMVDDVTKAIDWTRRNIHRYGGDPQRIWVVGQSAGGHLATTAILRRAMALQQSPQQQPSRGETSLAATTTTSPWTAEFVWRPSDLCGLISVSAPYNFAAMSQTFRKHGLSSQIVNQMFPTDVNPDEYDPYCLVQRHVLPRSVLPTEIHIWHGTCDNTVPWTLAQSFGQAWQQQQVVVAANNKNRDAVVQLKLYPEWTHTDAILEKPMSGSHEFHVELANLVLGGGGGGLLSQREAERRTTNLRYDENHDMLKPLWTPPFLAEWGRFWIPF